MKRKKKRNMVIASENDVRAWEKRREKRFEEENEVVIEWREYKDPKRNDKIYAFTQNLAIGGTQILTDINFPINTTFMITLKLSRSKQNIKVGSTVRWVKPVISQDLYEVGLELSHDFPQTVSSLIRHLFGHDIPKDVALETSKAENRAIYL
ncbi:MAG: PilZ domain-containing protein [Candidatus Aminicenantes bacterium]|nr:PilZ domain-containing protein [Candidatus Aminicenantes bacterium]